MLDKDGLLRLCACLTISSVHLSGRLTRSLNERPKVQYTAHREQECVIALYIDTYRLTKFVLRSTIELFLKLYSRKYCTE